jgi:hypothetical protein
MRGQRNKHKGLRLKDAPYAVRLVRRAAGEAAVVLARRPDPSTGGERLKRVAALSPVAVTAGRSLLREAASAAAGRRLDPEPGPSAPIDADWGVRLACYALVSQGLRDADRLGRAAEHLRRASPAEAAWWLGLMTGGPGSRAVRALRILTEAVA